MASSSRKQYRSIAQRAGGAVKWLAILVALVVSWLNVQPFMAFVLWALPDINDPVVQFFLGLPVIGSLAASAGSLLVAAAGIAIWGVVTLIEIFPGLIKLSREDVARVVTEYRSHGGSQLQSQENDPSVIQQLVDWHNNLPAEWIKALFRAQSLAFCIDFVASFIYYYPLKSDLQVFLSAPSIADVDWLLALIVVLCVYTSNIVLAVICISEGGNRTYRSTQP